jgi:hypothetical protein
MMICSDESEVQGMTPEVGQAMMAEYFVFQ